MQFSIDFESLPVSAQIGMAAADEHADEKWKRVTDAAILAVARRCREFTTDQVWEELGDIPVNAQTHRRCAIGPRMKRVARELGYMENTGRVQRSKQEGSNGNLLVVWKSKVFTEATT
jgi:hypothetical protein